MATKTTKRVATIEVWDGNARTKIKVETSAHNLTFSETRLLLRSVVRRLAGAICDDGIRFANYGVDRMRVRMGSR